MTDSKFTFNQIPDSDERIFRAFYDRFYPRVLAYLHKALDTRMYAEDIAQEVFIRFWKSRAGLQDPSFNAEAYLFTILRNTIATYFRNLLRTNSVIQNNNGVVPDLQSDRSADALLDYKSVLFAYESALAKVSSEKQRYFRMHREQGLTYHQIAEMEGVSERTVKFYISDTIATLRRLMPSMFFFLL